MLAQGNKRPWGTLPCCTLPCFLLHQSLGKISYLVMSLLYSLTFLILWTAACQAPVFMGFPRQDSWSGFLAKITGVDFRCHFLLQGIFLTQDRTHVFCIRRWILYHWANRDARTLLHAFQPYFHTVLPKAAAFHTSMLGWPQAEYIIIKKQLHGMCK